MSDTTKTNVEDFLRRAEGVGMLPKGTTDNLLESYDTIVNPPLPADAKPAIPADDSSTGSTFVKGKSKLPPPSDKE